MLSCTFMYRTAAGFFPFYTIPIRFYTAMTNTVFFFLTSYTTFSASSNSCEIYIILNFILHSNPGRRQVSLALWKRWHAHRRDGEGLFTPLSVSLRLTAPQGGALFELSFFLFNKAKKLISRHNNVHCTDKSGRSKSRGQAEGNSNAVTAFTASLAAGKSVQKKI